MEGIRQQILDDIGDTASLLCAEARVLQLRARTARKRVSRTRDTGWCARERSHDLRARAEALVRVAREHA